MSEQEDVWLSPYPPEAYGPGSVYQQQAHEIHETHAMDGTVTILERQDDAEGHADIFWPCGTEWGSAVPRQATEDEVARGVLSALVHLDLVNKRV